TLLQFTARRPFPSQSSGLSPVFDCFQPVSKQTGKLNSACFTASNCSRGPLWWASVYNLNAAIRGSGGDTAPGVGQQNQMQNFRSEERRVGKECRGRLSEDVSMK